MASTKQQMLEMFQTMGSTVTFHREDGGIPCPCLSPEGFRSPQWHFDHPVGEANSDLAGAPWNGLNPPSCNEAGVQTVATEFIIKAAVQPVRMRYNRNAQREQDLLGAVQADDRIGIFPVEWDGQEINFDGWSDAGEDFILYDGKKYTSVNSDKVPDIDGEPDHHWEVGLRLMSNVRPAEST